MTYRVEAVVQNATTGVAIGGVSLPLWLTSVEGVSAIAAQWMPILGAIWLVTQILRAWFGRK